MDATSVIVVVTKVGKLQGVRQLVVACPTHGGDGSALTQSCSEQLTTQGTGVEGRQLQLTEIQAKGLAGSSRGSRPQVTEGTD